MGGLLPSRQDARNSLPVPPNSSWHAPPPKYEGMRSLDYNKCPPLLFEIGGFVTRAGWGGDDAPRSVFPTLISHSHEELVPNFDRFCSAPSIDEFDRPVQYGRIADFRGIEAIVEHALKNELKVCSEDHSAILVLSPYVSFGTRSKFAEILFEKQSFQGIDLVLKSAAGLYTSGRKTGFVVSTGYDETHCIAVREFGDASHYSHGVQESLEFSRIGGRKIREHLMSLHPGLRPNIDSPAQIENARTLVKRACYVAKNFEAEAEGLDSHCMSYDLPDGSRVKLGSERVTAPEILFRPSVAGLVDRSIPGLIKKSFESIPETFRKQMRMNIVLEGSTTTFSGFAERLLEEIQTFTPPNSRLKFCTPPERHLSAWIGASIWCTLSIHAPMMVLREEWDEYGTQIIHKKVQSFWGFQDIDYGEFDAVTAKSVTMDEIDARIAFIRQTVFWRFAVLIPNLQSEWRLPMTLLDNG